MTAIRHSVQTQVLGPEGERLVSVLSVAKPGKRKKDSAVFLCLSVSQQQPVVARLRQIKAGGKLGDATTLETKKTWLLREVREVDGINPRKPVPELQLKLRDKLYRWEIGNQQEKEPFIHQLYKLQSRYGPSQRAEFINVSMPVERMEAEASAEAAEEAVEAGGGEEFAPLTDKEERDFRALLAKSDCQIAHAEAFQARLTRQLNLLDAENIGAIMGQEAAVEALLGQLDTALREAEELEDLLETLDALLDGVRESVEAMQEKDAVIGVESDNRRRLAEHLELFLAGMELLGDHEETSDKWRALKALSECDLSQPKAIHRVSMAAQALHKATSATIPPGLTQMKAYKDQQELFTKLGDRMAERVVGHLTTLFQQLSHEEEAGEWHDLMLPKHSQRHHALKVFSDLVGWLAQNRLAAYKTLQDRYVAYTKDLYRRQLFTFFAAVKAQVKPASSAAFDRKPSLSAKAGGTLGRSPALARSSPDRDTFIKLLETLLSELEPVVLDEQKFVIRFLHLQSSASEKAFNEQVRSVLEALFGSVGQLLEEFLRECQRAEPRNVVFLLARLSRHVLSVQDTGAYIAIIFGSSLIQVKRDFDAYMGSLDASFREVRLTKKARVGIVDAVPAFEEVAKDMEYAWRGVERKAEADKWCPKLLSSVWEGIEAAAADPNSKSPAPILRMENYHRLFSQLKALKISSLEAMLKECRARYQAAVDEYSTEYMGKPLEKLTLFFDQIQVTLDAGMKAEEVGYQQAFSKTELKKLIAAYPGKELQKGLDSVYRKLEKHLGTDSPLLQVVWHQMQNALLEQYKQMEGLMARCYPSAGLRFDFSLQDLLGFFSDIAQQH